MSMEKISGYVAAIRRIRPSKRLGQNFLINKEIAKKEALYGSEKVVLEVGPGLGILTKELCAVAKKVIAIEKDSALFSMLQNEEIAGIKPVLVNKDFLDVPGGDLKECEIMISNIPYAISSKVVMFLVQHRMPALLCLQKEFVDRMMANPGNREYSRLSVFASLNFTISIMMKVSASNFYPIPKVDSSIVFLRPKKAAISKTELKLLALIMEHKKKKLSNAVRDSHKALGLSKQRVMEISGKISSRESRPFQMDPHELLKAARELEKLMYDA